MEDFATELLGKRKGRSSYSPARAVSAMSPALPDFLCHLNRRPTKRSFRDKALLRARLV